METRNNETVDDMEYQQNDEQLIHIFDLHTVGLYSVYLILFIQFHALPSEILTLRLELLFFDSYPIIITAVSHLTFFYYKNPHLRRYMWRKIFSSSTIQPQNDLIEIELQSI